ncbi:hypothetical protein ACFPZ4_04985 [Micromonospora harpali]|uniref:Uncharacterized protein n=1 Tax=Micromonospora harpali TaxID=1490225 RepID=A0ABW1HKW8_9ACTN
MIIKVSRVGLLASQKKIFEYAPRGGPAAHADERSNDHPLWMVEPSVRLAVWPSVRLAVWPSVRLAVRPSGRFR